MEADLPVYVPFLSGCRYVLEQMKASFNGMTLETNREALLLSLIRGNAAYHGQHLREVGGMVKLGRRVITTGGGARIRGYMEVKRRWTGDFEYEYQDQSSLLGAAMLAHQRGGPARACFSWWHVELSERKPIMPVVPMQQILKHAFDNRYGVGAFNIVDWVTMDAVLSAAAETSSPVIVQVSVKTVKVMGAKLIRVMFEEMAGRVPIPATLHLDHCPDRKVIEECVAAGWNSVLFDASKLTYEDNMAQTKEVVQFAHQYGVAVEGELEAVKGVEDGVGDEYGGAVVALDKAVAFIRETGIDSFAPAIGTAHGLYKGKPKINFQRVSEIMEAEPIPLVVHGGTGLSDETFHELIRRGTPKINISTQLKITLADSYRTYLEEHPTEYDPLKLLGAVKKKLVARIESFMRIFGSEGKAA